VLTTVKEVRKVFKIPCSVFNGLSVDGVCNSLGILRDHVMPYRGVGCDTIYMQGQAVHGEVSWLPKCSITNNSSNLKFLP